MRVRDFVRAPLSLGAKLTSPLRHIRAKIIVPYVILSVVVAGAGAYLVTQLVASSLQERFDNQLAEAGRVAADAVVRKEEEHLEIARAIAFTQGVPEATLDADLPTLEKLVSPVAANEGAAHVEVVDRLGKRLTSLAGTEPAAGQQTDAEPGDPGEWWIVQQVLSGADANGDKYASLVETESGLFFFTAAPLSVGGQIVGAVLVGTPLDSVAAEMKSQALADVTIYSYDGNPIASTFVLTHDGHKEADLALDPRLAGDALNMLDSSPRDSRSLFGRNYDLAYGRLQIRQSVVGLYSVALPTNFLLSAGATTRTNLSVLFGLAITAVLIVGYVVAQRITGPILKLVDAARSVASGDLRTRSGVRTGDETGWLAQAFDQMTESLETYAEQVRRRHIGAIEAVTSAVDARDPYTLGHSVRVGKLARALGQRMGLPEETLHEIEIGGYLHDIGKIGVRDAILMKTGPLTLEERRIVDTHPVVACHILQSVDLSPEVLDFVRSHHERLDGSGYPDALSSDEISLVARIAAVADMYDAMTSDRPYRAAMAPEAALADLQSKAGRWLDADVIAALEAILPTREQQLDTEEARLALKALEAERGDASRAA